MRQRSIILTFAAGFLKVHTTRNLLWWSKQTLSLLFLLFFPIAFVTRIGFVGPLRAHRRGFWQLRRFALAERRCAHCANEMSEKKKWRYKNDQRRLWQKKRWGVGGDTHRCVASTWSSLVNLRDVFTATPVEEMSRPRDFSLWIGSKSSGWIYRKESARFLRRTQASIECIDDE